MDGQTVKRDIDVILWSMKLYDIRRYWRQRFWEIETQEAFYASKIESSPHLESVAEHSWHVADTILVLHGNFPSLSLERCLRMAILHDKMEILIGDKDPLGQSGTGSSTHAFNENKRLAKALSERKAIDQYLDKLRSSARAAQAQDLIEVLEGVTEEARFVKAVDKLQALVYVTLKKRGRLEDRHLHFALRYSEKVLEYYPLLEDHYRELRWRFLTQVAQERNTTVEQLEAAFGGRQLPLFSLSMQHTENDQPDEQMEFMEDIENE